MTYIPSMKITDGITTILFDSAQGFTKVDELSKIKARSQDGTLYTYRKYFKRTWTIPLLTLDKVSSDQFNQWWSDVTLLTFFPDNVNSPYQSYIILITNDARPLSVMSEYTWEQLFDGSLTIEEV